MGKLFDWLNGFFDKIVALDLSRENWIAIATIGAVAGFFMLRGFGSRSRY